MGNGTDDAGAFGPFTTEQYRAMYDRQAGRVVEVDAAHPLWKAWDDDDWNGATAANWITNHIVAGVRVRITPAGDVPAELLGRICKAFIGRGAIVELKASK